MKEYKVGQVLYLIGEKSTKIMPVQVVEEVIRTTIQGKEKTYTIQLPDKKETRGDIKDLKGSLFQTTSELKEYMFENASSAIENMITSAVSLSEAAFDVKIQIEASYFKKKENAKNSPSPSHTANKKKNKNHVENSLNVDSSMKIDLGDGVIGKVNIDNLKSKGIV